jgi:hypothetical protein
MMPLLKREGDLSTPLRRECASRHLGDEESTAPRATSFISCVSERKGSISGRDGEILFTYDAFAADEYIR